MANVIDSTTRPVVDARLIPDTVKNSFAHFLLEDFRHNPELAERYERETGKNFYLQRKKGCRH